MNIARLVDYFIRSSRFADSYDLRKSRLFVRACLLTSIFSTSYIWLSIIFGFEKGVYLMSFNALSFLVLPFLAKTQWPIALLGNIYVAIGGFAVVVLTYFSGGIWSGIYPWIISIPVLALLVVNRLSGAIWGAIAFGFMAWFGIMAIQGIELPVEYNIELRTIWYVTIVPGLLLIILFISFVFEISQNNALKEVEQKNEVLKTQKETIAAQSSALEKLIEEKDYIIRILAHDLRNPLKNIVSLVQLIGIEDDPLRKQECIQMIKDSSTNAQNLVNRVLEMDASEQEIPEITLKSLDLLAILNDVIDTLSERAGEKRISIEIENESGIKSVHAESTYLTLILENLISNAIKFSENDKRVRIQITKEGSKILIFIIDEGPGIRAEEEDKLFQKFSKLSARPTGGESSTGLGLSLVKRYTEFINGRVRYERDVSSGATFVVELNSI